MPQNTDLKKQVERQALRMKKAEHEKPTLMGQSIFIGTLGLLFVIPVFVGAYLGLWLDKKMAGYSVQWTISCLILGVIIGAVNVYLYIRE